MLIYFIVGICCILIGGVAGYKISSSKKIPIIEENRRIQNYNLFIEKRNEELLQQRDKIQLDIDSLEKEKNNLNTAIQEKTQQAEEFGKVFYEQQIALVNEKFDRASEELCKHYQEAAEKHKEAYLESMEEMTKEAQEDFIQLQASLSKVKAELAEAFDHQAHIVELNKQEQKKKDKIDFYKLQLSKIDLNEVQKLRNVGQHLRNVEPLNKVIWKSYYEKPFTDLIGRLMGLKTVSGIYKITNLETQQVYIGQSVNIKERFRQHIKRGLGAETPTRNKLYNAMETFGVENFTYEIVETCPKAELNDKERYWIDYFKSQEFGYNETRGNA